MVKLMVDTFIKSFLLSEALVFILGIFKILSFKVLTFAIEVSNYSHYEKRASCMFITQLLKLMKLSQKKKYQTQ